MAGFFVTLTGGDDNDTIINTGDSVTVKDNAGDDFIINAGNNVLFEYTGGDGDDTISGFNETSTLSVAGGAINTLEVDGDLVIYTDDGSVTLTDAATLAAPIILNDTTPANSKLLTLTANNDNYTNSAALVTILALEGNDTIDNTGDNVSIDGAAGNDLLINTGKGVTIDGGSGKDTIRNDGGVANVLNGGDGNDIISGSGNRSTVFGGAGNDNLELAGYNLTADAGDGSDSILNNGSQTTITGGKGNDSIQLADNSKENLLAYTAGDGSDTVWGFKATDTLSIAGGAATSTKSGNDLVFTVGNDSILLVNAASLEPLNVINDMSKYIELTPKPDTYINTIAGATIDALASDDNITNTASDVSINGNAGNDTVINTASLVTIDGAAGDDLISLSPDADNVIVEYVTGDGNDTVWNFGSDDSLIAYGYEFSSVKSGSDILVTIDAGTILLKNAASISGNLNITEKDPPADSKYVKLTQRADDYANTVDGATVAALGGNDTLVNSGTGVSINGGRGDDNILSDGDFVTITGDAGNDNLSLSAGSDSVLIEYMAGHGSDTVWGFNGTSTLSVAGSNVNSVTVDNDILVTLDGGSVLLKDAAKLPKDEVNLAVNGSVFNPYFIVLTHQKDLYENALSNATIWAKKGDDTILNSGDDVEIGLSNGHDYLDLTGDNATVNLGMGNDTVKIGSGVTKLTLEDFNVGDVIELSDPVDSIATRDGSLVAGNVTIGGIGSTADRSFSYYWSVGNGTAKYMKTDIKGGAERSADGKYITFVGNRGSNETIFTLRGINPDLTDKDLEQLIEIKGETIILPKKVLGKTKLTLSTSYNYGLQLEEPYPQTDIAAGWHFLDETTSASLTSAGKSNSYTLKNPKTILYTDYDLRVSVSASGFKQTLDADSKTFDEDKAKLEAILDKNLTFDAKSKTLTVQPTVVGDEFTTQSTVKVVFGAGNYSGSWLGTTGKDTVTVHGSGLTLNGGKGNDNFESTSNAGNVYLYSSTSNNDVITGYGDKDTIKVTDGSFEYAENQNSNIYIKIGRASVVLKDAATGTRLVLVDESNNVLIDQRFYGTYILEDGMIILNSNYPQSSYTVDAKNPNVSAVKLNKKITLTGGAEDNKIIGGYNHDWIAPGAGKNLLTGNGGADTFVYGGGNDTITDYGKGKDVLYLNSPLSAYEVKDNGSVILKVASGSVTLLDAVDKKITYFDGTQNQVEIFNSEGRFSSNRYSVVLPASSKSFVADSNVYTIDGSLTNSVNIVGNGNTNEILGGKGNDTLSGFNSYNTLTGGAGKDVFVLDNGYTTVTDYTAGEDKILLTSEIKSWAIQRKGTDIVVATKSGGEMHLLNPSKEYPVNVTFTDGTRDSVLTVYDDKVIGAGGATLFTYFYGEYTATAARPVVDASANIQGVDLYGGNENNTLIGGTKSDWLSPGAGTNYLFGGNGNDLFIHAGGNDILADYTEGKDQISVPSAWKNYKISGDDVILNFNDNSSVTIKDGRGVKITLQETTSAGGVEKTVNIFAAEGLLNSGQTAITLDAATRSFNAEDFSKIYTVDGTKVTSAVQITGNGKNNDLYAGNFGSTLNGGAGNDALWGGNGSDTFVYDGDGSKDTIVNFGNNDRLQVNGDFSALVNAGKEIVFTVGKGTLTLTDYTATTFNVNGSNYQISGSEFIKK